MAKTIWANWYDFPHYYELAFADETRREVKFLEAAFARYSAVKVETVLEPACGSGRLLTALAARSFRVVGFDVNRRALVYARRRLERRGLAGIVFRGDMRQFALRRPVDAVCCTFDSFRHLLTEREALAHLRCVAECLRPGGIYVLGVHLLPPDAADDCTERWRARRGKLQLAVTLRVLKVNRRMRREWLRISLRVHGREVRRICWEFPLRIYTAGQLKRLVDKCGYFEHCATFDYWYEVDHPCELTDEMVDTVLILRRR